MRETQARADTSKQNFFPGKQAGFALKASSRWDEPPALSLLLRLNFTNVNHIYRMSS